jgi:PAS domain-containing protein
VELQSFHANGVWRAYSVAFIAERDDRGVISGAPAVARELTEQVRAARALQAKEREFRTLAENATGNIARWDTDARMIYFNPVMSRIFGSERERVLGLTPIGAVAADRRAQCPATKRICVTCPSQNGRIRPAAARATTKRLGIIMPSTGS